MGFIRNFFARRKLRGSKNSIHRIFFKRTENYTTATIQILEKMPGALEAVSELIEEREPFKAGGILNWGEISLVAGNTDDALIVLVGVVSFPSGAEVELQTGEKVTVTKDTEQYFQPRMVRIGIPLKLAEASKEEVIDYLRKTDIEQKKNIEDIKKTLSDVFGINEEGTDLVATQPQDSITSGADFDLTQLTEEQRKQLELSTKMGRG